MNDFKGKEKREKAEKIDKLYSDVKTDLRAIAIAAASKVEPSSKAILDAMDKAFSAHSRRPVNLGHYFMSNADKLAQAQIEGGQFR